VPHRGLLLLSWYRINDQAREALLHLAAALCKLLHNLLMQANISFRRASSRAGPPIDPHGRTETMPGVGDGRLRSD